MHKPLLLLFILVFSQYQNVFSQSKDSNIKDLLLMEEYSNDKEAEALIIYDIGDCFFERFDNSFRIRFTRKCRIKILKEAGLEYTKIKIPLYFSAYRFEEIDHFNATTYNIENGKYTKTKTVKSELFEEKINKNWIQKTIAISGVKVGSVIDFEYTVTSPFIFNFHDWEFQYEIPVVYSEFVAHMIPFYTYSYIIIGTKHLDELSNQESKGLTRQFSSIEFKDMDYKFVKKNIPAFKDASFISSPSDYKMKLDFQLSTVYNLNGGISNIISTWEDISKSLMKNEHFGKYIKTARKPAKKIIELNIEENTSEIEMAKTLTSYVKNNFTWDGRYNEFAQKKVKLFLKEKVGNVGNINLFLVSLLKEAGIDAKPIILSTRDNGKIYYDYPFSHFFNYVIVNAKIDGESVFIDATEKHSTFSQLPYRSINGKGLIINKEEVEWVELNSNKPSSVNYNFKYRLSENTDTLFCEVTHSSNSFDALNEKKDYRNDSDNFFEEKNDFTFEKQTDTEVLSENNAKVFMYKIKGYSFSNKIESYLSFVPFMNACLTENPFNYNKREYPIDMVYSRTRSFNATLIIPENSELINTPQNTTINNEYFNLNYTTNLTNQILTINGKYSFKKPLYDAKDYVKLSEFTDQIINSFNSSIQIKLP